MGSPLRVKEKWNCSRSDQLTMSFVSCPVCQRPPPTMYSAAAARLPRIHTGPLNIEGGAELLRPSRTEEEGLYFSFGQCFIFLEVLSLNPTRESPRRQDHSLPRRLPILSSSTIRASYLLWKRCLAYMYNGNVAREN